MEAQILMVPEEPPGVPGVKLVTWSVISLYTWIYSRIFRSRTEYIKFVAGLIWKEVNNTLTAWFKSLVLTQKLIKYLLWFNPSNLNFLQEPAYTCTFFKVCVLIFTGMHVMVTIYLYISFESLGLLSRTPKYTCTKKLQTTEKTFNFKYVHNLSQIPF